MFTSKKALYLNKDFDRISPITNIESLYYELAEISNNTDSSYIIRRKSVAKHMPIRVNVNNSSISVKQTQPQEPGEYLDACVNLNINKTYILNPPNPLDNNRPIYDYLLFKIDTNQYINIQDLLKYYVSNLYMSSSIGEVYINFDNINSSITNVSNYVNNTSLARDALVNAMSSHTEYYTWNELNTSTLENNGIYNLIYYPYESDSEQYIKNTSFIIKVLCVYINNTKHIISLDTTLKYRDSELAELWGFHYDFDTSIITYLKDEYGNEGNFDFRIHRLKNINRNIFYSNICDVNNCKNNSIYLSPEQLNDLNIAITCSGAYNIQIYNSNEIIIESDSQESPANNIINNSYSLTIKNNSQNNNISNSSNYYCDVSGNNNTIINCNDCSINILGDNNMLINLRNQNLVLGDNNIIIGDEVGCPNNYKILNNDRLFLNYSTSTALATDHTSSCTFYGGIGNDVSVYISSLRTTNK